MRVCYAICMFLGVQLMSSESDKLATASQTSFHVEYNSLSIKPATLIETPIPQILATRVGLRR